MSQLALEVVVLLAALLSFTWLAYALIDMLITDYKYWQWKKLQKEKQTADQMAAIIARNITRSKRKKSK